VHTSTDGRISIKTSQAEPTHSDHSQMRDLGGALLEQSHVIGTDGPSEDRNGQQTPKGALTAPPANGTPRRPNLEVRAITEIGLGDSPSILSADQGDPISLLMRAHSG